MHVDLDHAITLASLAASSGDVETEAAGLVSSRARGGKLAEEVADRAENTDVSRGIGSRTSSDRCLIDDDDFVDVLDAPQ